jgi:hypothetical protein
MLCLMGYRIHKSRDVAVGRKNGSDGADFSLQKYGYMVSEGRNGAQWGIFQGVTEHGEHG